MTPNRRVAGAIPVVLDALAAAGNIPVENIAADEDFVDDLVFDELELESFALIVEEIFRVAFDPETLFRTPLYRTAESFAEWVVAESDRRSWQEAKRA